MKYKLGERPEQAPSTRPPDPPVSEISVQRLIDDSLLVLYREVKNLMMLSVPGKLEPSDARDLRDHLKLLFELKDREDKSLRNMTDEQLREMVKELVKDETNVK